MKTYLSILSAFALVTSLCFGQTKDIEADFLEDFLFEESLAETTAFAPSEDDFPVEDLFTLEAPSETAFLLDDVAPFEAENNFDPIEDTIPWISEKISESDSSYNETAFVPALVPANIQEKSSVMINFRQVFFAAPVIYTILMIMSVGSFAIWIQSFFTLRKQKSLPSQAIKQIKENLEKGNYEEAAKIARNSSTVLGKMLASAILHRAEGLTAMLELTKSEGKRASISFWQKMQLLGDVAAIAPMIGLLGTVVGMFYAFYDLNRSSESVTKLFDGLGVSVGTTVAGLIVALLAMAFYSLTKFRLVRVLNQAENEVHFIAPLIAESANSRESKKRSEKK